MRPGVNINCCGEQHRIEWDAEGNMLVPEHDVELEQSMVELGAEEPRCLAMLRSWHTETPLDNEAFRLAFLGVNFKGWALAQLGIDFADHVLWVYDAVEPKTEVPEEIREIIAAARATVPYDITYPESEMFDSMSVEVRRLQSHVGRRSYRYYANDSVIFAVAGLNYGRIQDSRKAAEFALDAAGFTTVYPVLFGAQLPWRHLDNPQAQQAMADERTWQNQRAVQVLKTMIQGEAFPRLF
jgi:hypothetical protein